MTNETKPTVDINENKLEVVQKKIEAFATDFASNAISDFEKQMADAMQIDLAMYEWENLAYRLKIMPDPEANKLHEELKEFLGDPQLAEETEVDDFLVENAIQHFSERHQVILHAEDLRAMLNNCPDKYHLPLPMTIYLELLALEEDSFASNAAEQ